MMPNASWFSLKASQLFRRIPEGRAKKVLKSAQKSSAEIIVVEVIRTKLDHFLPVRRRKSLLTALGIAFLCYTVFHSVLWPVQVLGDSMRPTFYNGTRHFVNKLAYWTEEPS